MELNLLLPIYSSQKSATYPLIRGTFIGIYSKYKHINCPHKQHIPDASSLKVLFYHVSHSKFLVLTYDIFEMTVSKKK
jgi:hypothetical protein